MSSSKPAGEQRGGEKPGRRSLEGVGGVQGFLGKIFGFAFIKESHSQLLGAVVWPAAVPMYQASAGWTERGRVE